MRYISPRRIVLLATLVLLIAPWASAAPRPGSTPPSSAFVGIGIPDVLSLAWRFITGGWIKEGCHIDPSGRCVTTLPTKEGCTIEPDGRCMPTKTGCHIDPSGQCVTTSDGSLTPAYPANKAGNTPPDRRYRK
jgi:hypothetical protein